MSRASIIALLIFLTAAAGAVAAPGLGDDASTPGPGPAGIRVPATPPTADPKLEHAYGYRSSDAIARDYGYEPGTSAGGSGNGTSATVVVTAFVAPVRTIVLDGHRVASIVTNTDRTGAGDALYVVREGSESGDVIPITADNWPAIRAALADSASGTGAIYQG